MSDQGPSPDPAKSRFITLQALRWAGLACVVVGLMVLRGKIAWPEIAGYLLVLNGLFDALILPPLLARRWKSPPQ